MKIEYFENKIETITNDNGTAIKFPDGTMICYINKKLTLLNTLSEYGSIFQTIQDWTFPEPFKRIPAVSCGEFAISTGASWGTVLSSSVQKAVLRVIDIFKRDAGEEVHIQAIAIGRWK